MRRLQRFLCHLWWDARVTQRKVPDDVAERLAARIAASEHRHSGEVRICVEAALPVSWAWRISGSAADRHALIRQRALQWFGELGIWDTESNNGVLIYLLLAERAIEIVADRGLARHVSPTDWQDIVTRLAGHLHAGDFENGLTQALEEVSALLVQHHGMDRGQVNPDELPNAVVRA